jgi:aryl-alcohol dehydrogenase-like predicted oxidoreductase/enamine deaminase RidA (YjgF/YER057c/UK114 family)
MKTSVLGEKLTISRIITGMWQIADMEKDGNKTDAKRAAAAMLPYAENGLTTFDMADHYGSSEDIAGTFRANYPGQAVQFLTKWVPEPGKISKDETRHAIEKALTRTHSSCIDLMQFHAWHYANPNWLDCLYWLEELRREGLIGNIGVTNFDTAHLNIAIKSGIKIVSNQVCYSLLDQRAAGAMTQLCRTENIGMLAFGTMAGGFLSKKWLGKREPLLDELTNWSLLKYKRFIDNTGGWKKFQELLAALDVIAKKRKVGIAAVASSYILRQPAVSGIIIGARLGESSHLESNMKIADLILESEECAAIKNIISIFNPVHDDCGDEYRKPPYLTASGDLSHHVQDFPKPYQTVQADGKLQVFSGTVWEPIAGYCRAVRKGNIISVSGTTSTHGSRLIGGADATAQTHFIIDKIEGALFCAGSKLEDVVRTRIFIRDPNIWEAVARAHGERFAKIIPTNTMVAAEMIGSEYLVEIEADAIVDSEEAVISD